MDRTDRQILSLLQEDATLSTAEIAERVSLTTTPCWRRIQKLEEQEQQKQKEIDDLKAATRNLHEVLTELQNDKKLNKK